MHAHAGGFSHHQHHTLWYGPSPARHSHITSSFRDTEVVVQSKFFFFQLRSKVLFQKVLLHASFLVSRCSLSLSRAPVPGKASVQALPSNCVASSHKRSNERSSNSLRARAPPRGPFVVIFAESQPLSRRPLVGRRKETRPLFSRSNQHESTR